MAPSPPSEPSAGTFPPAGSAHLAEARTAAILETMAIGYLAMDSNWVITYVNAEGRRVLNAAGEDHTGRILWEVFPAAVGTEFESAYRQAVATNQPLSLDAYYPAPLNAWFEVRAVPQDGGLTLYFLDVTARRAAEDARDEAVRQQVSDTRAMAGLVAAARALGDVDTEGEVLAVVEQHAVDLMGVRGATLSLRESDGSGIRSISISYSDEVMASIDVLPLDHPLPAVRTASTGDAIFLADLAATAAQFPGCEDIYIAGGVEASAIVPLRARGDLLGSLSVAHTDPHAWTDSERDLLEAFAALTAQALARITAHQAERIASQAVARFSETLQRSLLTSPAEPDHLQVAVRYSPAGSEAQVGGDWYDAFITSAGPTSLVIGDVTGHDRHAAAAMGQLRNILRGIGFTIGSPPAVILTDLDLAVRGLGVGTIASVILATVEQPPEHAAAGTRVLRWSNAGHLPPLLIEPGAAPHFLTTTPDLLIGIDPDTSRHDHTVVLAPGATVLLYTDGLIERRGAPLQAGLDWLADTVADLADLPIEELCDALLAAVGSATEDDVAMLALRAHPEDAPRPAEAGPGNDPLHEPDSTIKMS